MSTRSARGLFATAGPPLVAAVLGNGFVGKDALRWFAGLRRPAMQVPMPVFITVAGVYYGLMGTILHRSRVTGDAVMRDRTYVVLVGNELWNAALFGRRSPRAGFFGMVAFLGSVLALHHRAAGDKWARVAIAPYTAWVALYDLPWSYRLWRLNPTPGTASPEVVSQ